MDMKQSVGAGSAAHASPVLPLGEGSCEIKLQEGR